MRIWGSALAVLLLGAASAEAARVDVLVGFDDFQNGVAYQRYYPETVVIYEGDTVAWTAGSKTAHTVTSLTGNFDSSPAFAAAPPDYASIFGPTGFLMPSRSFNHTFAEAGEFEYNCTIHPDTMVGKIRIVDDGRPAQTFHVDAGWGSGEVSVDRFAPAEVTLPLGSTVIWTNQHSSEPHTVTGPGFDSSPAITSEIEAAWEGPGGLISKNFENQLYEHTFNASGTENYFCLLHPGQWGTVIVLPRPAEAETQAEATEVKASPGPAFAWAFVAFAAAAALLRRRRG